MQISRPANLIEYGINYKKGFTLAEILVTLAIIGVVAALTIPGLINSTNKSQYEVALKKNYSIINQAYGQLQANGVNLEAAFPGTDSGEAALNKIAPYLSIIKKCSSGAEGCLYHSPVKYLNGDGNEYDDFAVNGGNVGSAVLADGTILTVFDNQTNCTANYGGTGYMSSICGSIGVDINGAKGPNTEGIDVFTFWATKAGVYPDGNAYESPPPLGCDPSGDVNDASSSGAGWGCATRVLTKGMDY